MSYRVKARRTYVNFPIALPARCQETSVAATAGDDDRPRSGLASRAVGAFDELQERTSAPMPLP